MSDLERGALLSAFDPSDLGPSLRRVSSGFFAQWFGAAMDVSDETIGAFAAQQVGRAEGMISPSFRALLEVFAGLNSVIGQAGCLLPAQRRYRVHAAQIPELEAQLFAVSEDREVGALYYGVAGDALGAHDPIIYAYDYDEDDGAWEVSPFTPGSGAPASQFLVHFLMRLAPGQDAIGEVDDLDAFVERATQAFGPPLVCGEVQFFEGADCLITVAYSGAFGAEMASITLRDGAPVCADLSQLTAMVGLAGVFDAEA